MHVCGFHRHGIFFRRQQVKITDLSESRYKSDVLSFRLEDVYRSVKLAHDFGIDRLLGINST
jgi:hypothetical protein